MTITPEVLAEWKRADAEAAWIAMPEAIAEIEKLRAINVEQTAFIEQATDTAIAQAGLSALLARAEQSEAREAEMRTFAEFVARHSAPCRRDGLTDAEFRSIVENHPVIRDLLAARRGAG